MLRREGVCSLCNNWFGGRAGSLVWGGEEVLSVCSLLLPFLVLGSDLLGPKVQALNSGVASGIWQNRELARIFFTEQGCCKAIGALL